MNSHEENKYIGNIGSSLRSTLVAIYGDRLGVTTKRLLKYNTADLHNGKA